MSDATTGVPAANASVSTMPKLSPPSDGAHSTSAAREHARACRRRCTCRARRRSRSSSRSGAISSALDADDVQLARARARAAPRRRAAAPAGPCARRPGRRRRSAAGSPSARGARRGAPLGHVDAVGDDPVAPAVEAPAGPRGGLGDRDPHVQPVQPPARAEEVRDVVGDDVLGVAVERPDERRVDGRAACPSTARARPARAGGRRRSRRRAARGAAADAAGRVGDVRHRAVGREADRAPERDEVLGQLARCGRAPRCRRAARRSSGSTGDSTRTSWPAARYCSASASMCRVTPPGYVHEYGDTSAMRILDGS